MNLLVELAEEPVDLDAVTKIRNQGFRNSQVMDLAWHLSEGVGPRLTGSPQELQAHRWAEAKFEGWGLQSWLEAYDFGRSWMVERAQVRMTRSKALSMVTRNMPLPRVRFNDLETLTSSGFRIKRGSGLHHRMGSPSAYQGKIP